MTADRLIVQSVSSRDDHYGEQLAVIRAIHERYARACRADYQAFIGEKDPGVCASWNKSKLILEAFDRGYRKVVWLDVDTLVVEPAVDIFAETDNDVPLQLVPYLPHGDAVLHPPPFYYNAGVIVANASVAARAAMEYVWDRRRVPPPSAHFDTAWDQLPLNKWLGRRQGLPFAPGDLSAEQGRANVASVRPLDVRFNWMFDWSPLGSEPDAVIYAWHGQGPLALDDMRRKAATVESRD